MERRNVAPPGTFGALLRQFRAAANITQEELAERSGLSVAAIGALEQGVRRSPRPSTVEWLAEAVKLDARQKAAFVAAARGSAIHGAAHPDTTADAHSQLADAESLLASLPADVLPNRAPLPAGSRMPLAPNPLFVGRGDELLRVAAALKGADATVALGQVVASTGLGGLGKTQLAVELVHRYGRYFTGGVYWLSFASAEEIPLQVAACAGPGAMDLGPGIENRPVEERVERVQRVWHNAVPRLLVFDNCEDEALLEAWRPTSGGCRVLVTSRRSQWSPTLGVVALSLDVLPRQNSIELLRQYRPGLAADDSGLDAIAVELGDLPLALHLAGSYLRAYGAEVSLDDYLMELRRSDVVQHASLLGAGLDDSVSPTHHVQGVAQTFAVSLGRLDREREVDRVAIAVLARMACMAPGEPVPRNLLGRTLEDLEPRLRADGLRRLASVGLVEEGERWLRVHRLLVHFVRHAAMDHEAQPAVARALIGCGEDAKQGHLTGAALAAVIPHVVDAASAAICGTGDAGLAGELCHAAGLALQNAGDLEAARPWYERAQAIRERVLGPDHLLTADNLNDLGVLLRAQGQMAAARPLLERAVAIRERELGRDHPLTAQSLNNLGVLLCHQGDLAAARPLHESAVAIRERVLGHDHPDTANSLYNLGSLLRDQGELAAARPLIERAIRICERVMGPDHPYTAYCLNGLALLHRAQGELDAARTLFERALGIRERVLGPDHLNTAVSLNDLALLHRDEGDPSAARPLLARALAIRERALGPDHPDTVATRRALRVVAEDEGDRSAVSG